MIFTTEISDFQKEKAERSNTGFGNRNFTTSEMLTFTFETLSGRGELQSLDFYLQTGTYVNGAYQWEDYLLLDDTYKQTGYFEAYEFAINIVEGCYRIRAGAFHSIDLLKAVNISIAELSTGIGLADNNDDTLVDNNGDTLVQPI